MAGYLDQLTWRQEAEARLWTGFYIYQGRQDRHRTDLALEFGKGVITGEGVDDIGVFVVRGRYEDGTKECHWTKTYVGQHDVFYQGVREGKGIWGRWEIVNATSGGFKIWPLASGADDEGAGVEEKVEPVDAVGEVVGCGVTRNVSVAAGRRYIYFRDPFKVVTANKQTPIGNFLDFHLKERIFNNLTQTGIFS
jgi:hypothetical protein